MSGGVILIAILVVTAMLYHGVWHAETAAEGAGTDTDTALEDDQEEENKTDGENDPESGSDAPTSEPEEESKTKITRVEPIESSEVVKKTVAENFKAYVRRNLNEMINLQAVVDQWARSYRYQEAAVEVFDVDYNTVVASYRADAAMYPRSLYKLFYVYDAYAQIDAGADDANQTYLDDMSLGHCLDIIIRQSNNPCAEKMVDNDPPRAQRVGQLIRNLGLANTQSDGLRTSAHDVSLLLQHYYRHPDWSASSWEKFRSSALGQAWNYRKGLPSGFKEATVYDKTGFGYGSGGVNVYNDAAMVEFWTGSGLRRYIVVAMTTNPTSYTILTKLGMMLEEAILYEKT